MTAGLRDQLAEALRQAPDIPVLWPSSDRIADALLPTVDAMIRQAQATALELAASDWAADPGAVGDSEKDARNWLRDRADALRLSTDRPDVTHDAP